MTATIPTTLAEYQEFVRKEVLDIQQTQGMTDENMNAHLRALGLAEKRNFFVPVEVTGTMVAIINVNDALTEEEARASLAKLTAEELKRRMPYVNGINGLTTATAKVTTITETFAVGDPDLTLTNQTIYASLQNHDRSHRRQCENYDPNRGSYYCTLKRGHEGPQHVAGNGTTIAAVWPADAFDN
jgi:hypothetical protein